MHGQFAAAAEGEAIDRRDQRLGEAGDALPVGDARVVEDADQIALGHFPDIGAGGERLAAAGQHHGAGFGVLFGVVQFGGQFAEQFGVQRVEGLGTLQGDQAHARQGSRDDKGTRHLHVLRLHARHRWPAHCWNRGYALRQAEVSRVFRSICLK
ncbi:hypothetical protein FQZ97_753870 [compost metagenome]